MITALAFFLVLSVLIIIHELGHFLVAKKNNVYVEEFGFGLPPRIGGIRIGETLYSINLLPFGGFVKVLGEEYEELKSKKITSALKDRTFASKSPKVKLAILTAGVAANFLLGWIIISALFMRGVPVPSDTVSIQSVVPGSPAQTAGILPNDVIETAAVDSRSVDITTSDDLTTFIDRHKGTSVELNVLRGEERHVIMAVPRVDPPAGEGSLGIVISQFKTVQYPFYSAPFHGLKEAARISLLIVRELSLTLFRFVTFQPVGADVAGPVGIAKITGEAVRFGPEAVFQLLGLLSLNLAVINILPFPALDGGKVALVLYEVVRKKRVDPAFERRLNMVGFSVLIFLIILVTVSDVLKLLP